MMKKTVTGIGVAIASTIVAGTAVFADFNLVGGVNEARGDGMPSELFGNSGIFTEVTNAILFVVGILSVIMLIYGGLRYVISGGDAKKVTDAKNTIMYAIIGLVIAILSYAIVNFVIGALAEDGAVSI